MEEASTSLLQSLLRYVTSSNLNLSGIKILILARPMARTSVKTLVIVHNITTYHLIEVKMTY